MRDSDRASEALRRGDRGGDAGGIIAALGASVRDLFARPLAPGLHLVATPIGHLGDITPRALVTLAQADRVYCEDTRVSRPMLARFAINRPLASYHEHNAEAARREILAQIDSGRSVALMSDAGMPAISDPGFKLARAVIAAGADVFVIPGPTALTTALTASGLPTDSFFFAGFLPQKSAARQARIAALGAIPATLIFYESPHRVSAALHDLAAGLGPRPAAVARELTKKYEEVWRGPLADLAERSAATPPRGEIAIVVAPPSAPDTTDVSDEMILDAIRAALPDMRPAAAAKTISQNLGVPRARVYDLVLFLKDQPKG
ncbi:MAG: 16S rRNA (cytidine(1402)-2'-O)-methyltransferase [Hyphomicrobiaceae bacterium]